jgi:hypothetical protein
MHPSGKWPVASGEWPAASGRRPVAGGLATLGNSPLATGHPLLATCQSERGVALLMVIWMIVLLTAIAAEFTLSMHTDLQVTEGIKEETEAYYMAVAGYNAALAELMQPVQAQFTGPGGQVMLSPVALAGAEGEALVLPPPAERNGRLDTGSYAYELIDEEGLYPISTLALGGNRQVGTTSQSDAFREILRASGVTDEMHLSIIVDSLVDWMDMGDEHQLNGAEDDWYQRHHREQGMPFPYKTPDARRLWTAEEMLLIRGITPEILFGSGVVHDVSVLGAEIAAGGPRRTVAEGAYTGIYPHISAFARGQVRNKSTADPVVIAAFFPEEFDQIMLAREAGVPLGETPVSRTFSIVATGWSLSGRTHRTIKATVQRFDRGAAGLSILPQQWIDNYLFKSLPAPGRDHES